jgi:ribose 5-phosphate isomerase B
VYNIIVKIYLASDHAGYVLKGKLLAFIRDELQLEAEDCGAAVHNPDDDYPQFISIAAKKLSEDAAQGIDNRAIVMGGSGEGEAMVANRFKGVRCALYYGEAGEQTDAKGNKLDIISSAREHNNANALSLGARFITDDAAREAVRKFLTTPFSKEDRHMRRIMQIDQVS